LLRTRHKSKLTGRKRTRIQKETKKTKKKMPMAQKGQRKHGGKRQIIAYEGGKRRYFRKPKSFPPWGGKRKTNRSQGGEKKKFALTLKTGN